MSRTPAVRKKESAGLQLRAGTSLTLSPDGDLGVVLTLALSAFKTRLHEYLANAGYADLGPAYGFVFRTLGEKPHSLAELAARLDITPQGALKIVAEMIADGYVERRDDDKDKRVRWLLLTKRGVAALRAARKFHAEMEQQLIAELGADALAATRTVLVTIAAEGYSAGVAAPGARPF